jgi:hypothetical protein
MLLQAPKACLDADQFRILFRACVDQHQAYPGRPQGLMVMRMHDLNVPHATIAGILNISADTVTNYLKLYETGGLSALLENRYYQPSSSVEPYFEEIRLGHPWIKNLLPLPEKARTASRKSAV